MPAPSCPSFLPLDAELQRFAELAAALCEMPCAAIHLFYQGQRRAAASLGLSAEAVPWQRSLSAQAMERPGLYEIPDLDLVTGADQSLEQAQGIRAYAGVALISDTGEAVGVLCVMDRQPHALSDAQRTQLVGMARQVVHYLELLQLRNARQAQAACELLSSPDGTPLPVEYRVPPIHADGVLQGAACTFTDISECARAEALRSFMLDLSDHLQKSVVRVDLDLLLSQRLGRLLGVDRIAHGFLHPDSGELEIDAEWRAPELAEAKGRLALGEGAQALAERLEEDAAVPLDIPGSTGLQALWQRLECQDLLFAPLHEPRQALLLLGCRGPRSWTQAERSLVREIVIRLRAARVRTRVTRELHDAEQRISLANAIAAIGIWEFDPKHNSLHWDTQTKALAGMAPEAPAPSLEQLLKHIHPEDRPRLSAALADALDARHDGQLNLDYRTLDGRWLTIRGRRVDDEPVRILGTIREITAERNAADDLRRMNLLLEEQIEERRQAERRQAAHIELGDLLRGQLDSDTIDRETVRILASTLRLTRVLMARLGATDERAAICHQWPEQPPCPERRLALANHPGLALELRHGALVVIEDIRHDRRTATHATRYARFGLCSLVCVPRMEYGRLSAILILMHESPRAWPDEDIFFVRDVADRAWTADERMHAEQALRDSEEQFRTLADNMSQLAWMADSTGQIYWYNKRWYDLTGTCPDTMRALGIGSVHHPQHRERATTSLQQAFSRGQVWEDTHPLQGRDGRYRWFLSCALPISNASGEVIRWFGTHTDITAQVQAEEALRELNNSLERRVTERTHELADTNRRLQVEMSERERAEEALRHAQKMEAIGQLTGGLAHDFNNMLTGVLGALDLIQRRLDPLHNADLQRYLDAATSSANRAAALTHRLLAFARRQALDTQPVDVNELVLSMEDMLRRTIGEHIQLHTDLRQRLWPAYTDAHQLENALLNLVINARDAMPEGGRLVIQTRALTLRGPQPDSLEPGDYLVLSVEDSGCGMPAEVIAKAFDPFFTTKPIGQGTGLGLSMVYGFVLQTGGGIRIDSEPARGTRMTLLLPRDHQSLTAKSEHEPHGAAGEVPRAGAGETVLVVEDEAAVRMLVVEVLRELGYEVLEAVDGDSALALLQGNRRIDLMVSDVGLPGINGRQLSALARQLRPALKVLFITGYAPDAENRCDYLSNGTEMLTKPFNLDLLASRIRQMMEAEQPTGHPTSDPPGP
ncbi:PAS domain-containing protein [Stutzerimonas tarimensis]|uniref:histidine kinase n=1 Tax=Stutzerimonas tarimensis TaxID=1507735 RepID=A0ABV7T4Z9_9GAMM